MRQAHHLAVRLVGIQDTRAYSSDVLRQTHHQLLANRVDGGVRHLGELLTEVVEERLRPVAQHGQRRVVTHRGCRLLTVHGHRHNRRVDVLGPIAEHDLLLQQVLRAVLHVAPALQFLQLDAIRREPLAVRMLIGQLLLDFSVVINLSLLRVDEQDFSRLQASLLGNLRRVEVHHAHLRGHYHRVVLRDGIPRRSQSIPVEHTARKASVREQQGGRAVPRLHQDGVVLIERLQILRYRVLVVETLRHQHTHSVGQRESRHHEELQHIVEARRITHPRLHNRRDRLCIAQCLTRKHALSGLHPPTVAADGVDLAVVRQQAEGLGE